MIEAALFVSGLFCFVGLGVVLGVAIQNHRRAEEWKRCAKAYADRQEELLKWLARNCVDLGDFEREGNVIKFLRRER